MNPKSFAVIILYARIKTNVLNSSPMQIGLKHCIATHLVIVELRDNLCITQFICQQTMNRYMQLQLINLLRVMLLCGNVNILCSIIYQHWDGACSKNNSLEKHGLFHITQRRAIYLVLSRCAIDNQNIFFCLYRIPSFPLVSKLPLQFYSTVYISVTNILRPKQNSHHFPDDIVKWIFLK